MEKINHLKIYNSLSGKKESFKPKNSDYIKMYVCGPTVYGHLHLGNCRTFIFFDLVFRYLKHLGYKVRYVRNITDVGHLENDSDYGEDKIAKKSKMEKLEIMEIIQKYSLDFHKNLSFFNVLPPSIEPFASGHIMEQIEWIKKLMEKELAYEINGSVYFEIKAYERWYHYGVLSKRKKEITKSRLKQEEKFNTEDFALWKRAKSKYSMHWPSPWGMGFPGWHTECAVMSTKYLGESFDIHGGGIDLKFPHHECEIAQVQGFYGKSPVKYWMHTNMLTIKGQKMSKKTGNIFLPGTLFKRIHPSIIRFFLLKTHYRTQLDFSYDTLFSAERSYYRLRDSFQVLKHLQIGKKSTFDVTSWREKCYEAIDDDFNSPVLIMLLFEAVSNIEKKPELVEEDLILLKKTMHDFFFEVLGLELIDENQPYDYSKLIELIIQVRNRARFEKNWDLSDYIRYEMSRLGIRLKDGKESTQLFNKWSNSQVIF
jgi:cysteinyl-tRNA synthetase